MSARKITWIMATVATIVRSSTALAQDVNLSAGYIKIPGRIGDLRSDHGIAARLSGFLGLDGVVTFGGELGLDRLNEIKSTSEFSSCYLANGEVVPCTISQWARDWVLSAGALARLQTRFKSVAPFLTAGVVLSSTLAKSRQTARTETGTALPNLEFEGTTNDEALAGQIGIGTAFTNIGLPVDLTIEGRAAFVLYNYSGGWQYDTSPSILVGVRWSPRSRSR